MTRDGDNRYSMRSKILEQLGFGIWESTQDIKTLQAQNAEKENLQLLMEQTICEPSDIDEHNIHIAEHTAFMLGNEFEKSILKSPNLKEMMLNHIRKHKKFKKIEDNEKENEEK